MSTWRSHPFASLGQFPTPLHPLTRIDAGPGGGPLFAKRDDLAGFALGGNKVRPLEFILGDALAGGFEVVVGGGAATSNFVAALAVGASAVGLGCELIVPGANRSQTLDLARAAGATILRTDVPRERVDDAVRARAEVLGAAGRRAYPVPRGGATSIGALGFARAAVELAGQGVEDDARIVVPVGSAGSIAGLSVGLALAGVGWRVVGVCVSRPLAQTLEQVEAIAQECADLDGMGVQPRAVELVDATVQGPQAMTDAEVALIGHAYRSEGLLVDPHYGVKALSVAVGLAREHGPTVLWSTGGLPAALAAVAGTP